MREKPKVYPKRISRSNPTPIPAMSAAWSAARKIPPSKNSVPSPKSSVATWPPSVAGCPLRMSNSSQRLPAVASGPYLAMRWAEVQFAQTPDYKCNPAAFIAHDNGQTGRLSAPARRLHGPTGHLPATTGRLDGLTGRSALPAGRLPEPTGPLEGASGRLPATTGRLPMRTRRLRGATGRPHAATGETG